MLPPGPVDILRPRERRGRACPVAGSFPDRPKDLLQQF